MSPRHTPQDGPAPATPQEEARCEYEEDMPSGLWRCRLPAGHGDVHRLRPAPAPHQVEGAEDWPSGFAALAPTEGTATARADGPTDFQAQAVEMVDQYLLNAEGGLAIHCENPLETAELKKALRCTLALARATLAACPVDGPLEDWEEAVAAKVDPAPSSPHPEIEGAGE